MPILLLQVYVPVIVGWVQHCYEMGVEVRPSSHLPVAHAAAVP